MQTYTADTITLNIDKSEFVNSDPNSPWYGRTLYSLYQEAYTPWDWQVEIINHANARGILCFSSVFDESAVEFLESINIVAYKIASPEIIHHPLIREVAMTGKPIIMSTGMATLSEIDDAVNIVRKTGKSELALLKCTSSYPASPENSNIRTIQKLREIFECEVGLSDHTLGIGAAIAAVANGATIIEKHFTLDRRDGGVDSTFSIEPKELKLLVDESRRAHLALGKVFFGHTDSETSSKTGRRSIYVTNNVKTGDVLTKENIRVIRPNQGLEPKYYPMLLGRRMAISAVKGTPLSWEMVN